MNKYIKDENRYNELSKRQQAVVDGFINSVASGGNDMTMSWNNQDKILDADKFGHCNELTDMQIKHLTIQQLERIIDIRAGDFSVYMGIRGKVCLTSEVSHASLNGLCVQINLETAQPGDVMEDQGFQTAFEGEGT